MDGVPVAPNSEQLSELSNIQSEPSFGTLDDQEEAGLSRALNFAPTTSPSSSSRKKRSDQVPKYTKPINPYTGHISTLPPLPPILSDALAPIPFVHQGSQPGSKTSKLHSTYDRLEFLGDAYIEVIATRLVYSRFPNLPAGRLSQRREFCVKNETLAEYAMAYGFPERAKVPITINNGERKLWTKTMGDIFEAYVAAVILADPENGFQTVETWLTALWEYELSREQRSSKVETQVSKPDAKNDLAKAIGGRNVTIEYKDEGDPERIRDQGKIIFRVGVYLNGWYWEDQRLGSGSGLSKQEAGAMAAAEALQNPLLHKVKNVKKEYDSLVVASRAKGEEPPLFSHRHRHKGNKNGKG